MGWTTWVQFPAEKESFLHSVQTISGTHSAFYPMGTEGSLPGNKATRHEADHSPPPTADVESYTSTKHYTVFHFKATY
jgi:hypothetical protein